MLALTPGSGVVGSADSSLRTVEKTHSRGWSMGGGSAITGAFDSLWKGREGTYTRVYEHRKRQENLKYSSSRTTHYFVS